MVVGFSLHLHGVVMRNQPQSRLLLLQAGSLAWILLNTEQSALYSATFICFTNT